MANFVLTDKTQLLREMEVHEAVKEMARRLGISGQIETRVGDFRQKGWTTGWAGKPGEHDVLVEVYVVPLTRCTLSMETENLVLRDALDRALGEGASDKAIKGHRAILMAAAARTEALSTPQSPESGGEVGNG